MMDSAMNESRPVVGSSAKMIDGLVRISVAIVSRFFSPPLIPLKSPETLQTSTPVGQVDWIDSHPHSTPVTQRGTAQTAPEPSGKNPQCRLGTLPQLCSAQLAVRGGCTPPGSRGQTCSHFESRASSAPKLPKSAGRGGASVAY